MPYLLDAARLPAIRQAVLRAEQKYPGSRGERAFLTDGPRGATYDPLPDEEFGKYLNLLKLDACLRFAVLGAGFGMDSFVAATRFYEVIGFEIDPEVHAGAEAIRRDFRVENVRFICEDFLPQDLTAFGAVAFYLPFTEGFDRLMAEALSRLAPGTTVISFMYDSPGLFLPTMFAPHRTMSTPGVFPTYVRISNKKNWNLR
jgi:SAM-dependent methyltransferase